MKTSIRNKIVLSFTLLISLVFVCQLVFNMFFAKNYYLSYKSDAMSSAFEGIKQNYDGTDQSIEESVSHYEDQHNINVIVWSDVAGIVYTSHDRAIKYIGYSPTQDEGMRPSQPMDPQSMGPDFLMDLDDYQESPAAKVRQDPMHYKSDVQNLGLNGKVITEDEELYISLTLPMASIDDSVAVFSNSSLYISLTVLIAGLFFCIAISKSITKPVSDIQAATSQMANLDFSVHLDENVSSSELSDLSKSINSMSSQLQSTIDELNIANQKLQSDIDTQKKLERMRREFVGNVSHEMKTPLSLLQLYADNLKNNVQSIDKDYYCDTIIEESSKLSEMVSSMLDMSSIESGLSKIELSKISLSGAALDLLTKVAPLTENYNLKIHIEDDIFIDGNLKYIEQAMRNYLSNALEHTCDGDLICVSLSSKDDMAVFSVYNTGQPISELDMPFLWDSFYRADKARVREGGNAGLGLHIVKTIVLAHGGIYNCQNLDDGVEFSFMLPIID